MAAVRRGSDMLDMVELTVPSDVRFLEMIHTLTEQICRRTGRFAEEDVYKIAWGVHEACVNVIEHAHQFQASKPLRLQALICPDHLEFRVYDWGPGFNLDRVPEPDPAEIVERGRGVFGMRRCMDLVEYRQGADCNCLRLVRHARRV